MLQSVAYLLPKVFFTVDDDERNAAPIWVFNDKLQNADWKRYPIRVVHPLQCPPDLRGYGIVLEKLAPAQDLISSALHAGIFLTIAQLNLLHAQFKFALPEKGKGTGKKGKIVKKDIADRLLTHVFGMELAQDERQRMLAFIMGKAWNRLGKSSPHAEEILQAFKTLDPQDQPSLSELAAVAADEQKLKEVRAQRVDIRNVHASPAHETPRVLANLLPVGVGFYCRFNRHPAQQRYQVFVFHDSGISVAAKV